jgi:pimeloyl-ACP methyl ester carboxylesterase
MTVPTLVLWGAEDHVIPAYNAKTFDEMIPDSALQIFDGVGHLAMEEAPERTAVAISAFFDEVNLK